MEKINPKIFTRNQLNILRNIVHYTLEKRKYTNTHGISQRKELSKAVHVHWTVVDNWIKGVQEVKADIILCILEALELSFSKIFLLLIEPMDLQGSREHKDWLRYERRRMYDELQDPTKCNPFETEEL